MIKFDNLTHTYINELTNEQYISVTTLLKQIQNKKNWDEIAQNYANKNGNTKEHWLNVWENKRKLGCDRGTLIHSMFEYEGIPESEIPEYSEDYVKYSTDLKTLNPGEHKELLVYTHRYKVSGQSDKVIIYDDLYFDIEDYKTDVEIKFNSTPYYSKKHKKKISEKFLFPVQHLDECNWNKYQLQLSIYAYILESFGLKCRKLIIKHVISERDSDNIIVLHDGKPNILDVVKHECKYLKEEAESILKLNLK